MAGTAAGAAKAKAKLLEKDPDYYKKIGRNGGMVCGIKGFATMSPERRRELGKKGGTISRRSKSKK